jgi:rhamnulokinase
MNMSFPELVAGAEEAEPFRSLIDPDDLRFYGAGGMEERIKDYCRETGQPIPQTPGEVTRCILESLALRYRQAVEQLEEMTGMYYNRLHMVGGGIQNRLLCQFTAHALGRNVWAGPVEASAIGNMLVQLISRGHCKNLLEARKLVADSFEVDVYEPDQIERWEIAYHAYLNIAKEA